MLKFRKLDYRPWPVTVILLECDESTGEVAEVKHRFVVHFNRFSEADFEQARADAKKEVPLPKGIKEDDAPMELALRRHAALFKRLICGWGKEVADEAKQPIPFSPEALTALVTGEDGVAVSNALNQASLELRLGVAPAKNSPTSPAPGPTADEVAEAGTPTP